VDGSSADVGSFDRMIADVTLPGMASADEFGDEAGAVLLPEEASALGSAGEGRTREFTTARACARRALAALGFPNTPVLRGAHRQPVWPDGVVGSITHCSGYRAAAVAKRDAFLSLGIDAEVHRPLPAGVLERIALPEERAWLRSRSGSDVAWDCVLFSAKESVYKAWYPIAGCWLGFGDARVHIDVPREAFHVELLTKRHDIDGRRIDRFDGRLRVANGLVLTCVAVPAGTAYGAGLPA
jgi:4'-phosphopantetheinyl transferase EntD